MKHEKDVRIVVKTEKERSHIFELNLHILVIPCQILFSFFDFKFKPAKDFGTLCALNDSPTSRLVKTSRNGLDENYHVCAKRCRGGRHSVFRRPCEQSFEKI